MDRRTDTTPLHRGVSRHADGTDQLSAGYTLLLIEDDPGDALLVRDYLTDSDVAARLHVASTLAEAINSDHYPDGVLLDLHLPDGAGLEALRRVLDRWPQTAVLVLTGLDDAATAAAAVAAGAQDYLVKGQIDDAVLGRTIRYAIHRKRAQNAERSLRDSRLLANESVRLQRGLLPKPILADPAVRLASRYLPTRQRALLGGDFYDVIQTADGAVHAVIGDVCGSGPDEAAMGVALRVGWRTLTLAGVPKTQRMRLLEDVLVAERPHDGMFATVLGARIDLDRNQVVLTSAGHPPPLIVTADGAWPADVRHGLGLGMFPGRGHWHETTITLPPQAGLLLYTDGAFEGISADGTRLGEERFITLAGRLATITDPVAYLDALLAAVHQDDGRHNDDTALLYITHTRG
ncbi:PP2C family protein-serine/threonine phosphatase [Paractinoplanes globisporus]|uniref:PP2C family protein-serine/threonine phosphatase n=1 Tax=Paractinoplanes globisporus TaxID=113565 RepID=A0ABW6WI14_9ACTN|nr:fused response regulator/phosphatase [Actinoplanes globisporus]